MVTEQENPACGGNVLALYHLNLSRVLPGGDLQNNVYSVAKNGAIITVPENQVRAGYIRATTPYDVRLASAAAPVSRARFLILVEDPNDTDRFLIQSHGFHTFPDVHGYIIGQDYYLSDTTPGEFVTTAPATNPQRVFTVIDAVTILIDIQEV
jgi:hypothetical protein